MLPRDYDDDDPQAVRRDVLVDALNQSGNVRYHVNTVVNDIDDLLEHREDVLSLDERDALVIAREQLHSIDDSQAETADDIRAELEAIYAAEDGDSDE